MDVELKILAYKELVIKRKNYQFQQGLNNPSSTDFDVDEIEPWAQWQNNLNADILLVGQEFSDIETYKNTLGRVEMHPNTYKYPSNENLEKLFRLIGYNIGHPLKPNKDNPIFFTNAVMGLKNPPMSSNFKDRWINESLEEFLKPLVDLIKPKIIITLGTKAALSIGRLNGIKINSLKSVINKLPLKGKAEYLIYTFYHPGGLGLSSRPLDLQRKDWEKVRENL